MFEGLEKAAKKSIDKGSSNISYLLYKANLHIMQQIISDPNNKDTLEALLQAFSGTAKHSINQKLLNKSLFIYEWYNHFIFNWYSSQSNLVHCQAFLEEYYSLFRRYQLNIIKYIIDHDSYENFRDYIRWLHVGIGLHHGLGLDATGKLSLGDYITEQQLWGHYDHIKDRETLTNFLKFVESLETGESCSDDVNLSDGEVERLERSGYQQFYFASLQRMLVAVCGYCLFKRRYHYIVTLWKFTGDGPGGWSGKCRYPRSLSGWLDVVLKLHDTNLIPQDIFHDLFNNDYQPLECNIDYLIYLMIYLGLHDRQAIISNNYTKF